LTERKKTDAFAASLPFPIPEYSTSCERDQRQAYSRSGSTGKLQSCEISYQSKATPSSSSSSSSSHSPSSSSPIDRLPKSLPSLPGKGIAPVPTPQDTHPTRIISINIRRFLINSFSVFVMGGEEETGLPPFVTLEDDGENPKDLSDSQS